METEQKKDKEEEIDLYMNMIFRNAWENAIYALVKMEFPDIKNLRVESLEPSSVSLSFDEGTYTKKEVEDRINEVRNDQSRKLNNQLNQNNDE